MVALFQRSLETALDSNGRPASGALMYFYRIGTTTKLSVYGDIAAEEVLTNPVAANASGVFPGVYYDAATEIRAVLTTAAGAVIWDEDFPLEEAEFNTWFVSPSVSGTGGSGTAADPWSLEYADGGAGGQIVAGDTVLLRGQKSGGTTVPPFMPHTTAGLSRGVGFDISVSGTETKPITWKNFPGELVTFSDPISQSSGWTKVTLKEDGVTAIPASANVYESNFTVSGTTHFVNAYYTQNGDWHVIGALRGPTGAGPYTTSTDIEAMYATSSRFRQSGIYYPGPCIIRLGNGKLRIRLDPCYVEAHESATQNPFFGETSQVYPASTNPASVDIRIYRMEDVAIAITGDFNIFDGGSRESPGIVFHGWSRAGLRDQGNNNTIKGCRFYAPYIGLNVGATGAINAGTYRDNVIDGMLDFTKSPFSRGDVKNGNEVLVLNRGQGFAVASNASSGHFYRNTVRRCYDGTVFNTPNWEVGYTADASLSATEREALMWDYGNTWEMIWDDGMQVYSGAQGANIHHNKFLGAGPARDGAASTTAKGSNKVKVHHNIIDGFNYKPIWDRAGRNYTVTADGSATARSTVNGSFGTGATTITVADGTTFAALSLPRNLTLCKASAPWSMEQVQLTAVAGNDLTIVRSRTPTGGTTGDTAISLVTGDIVTTNTRDLRNSEEGRCAANVLPTHGVPTGTSYRFPWDFYHNTIITEASVTGQPNLFMSVMMFGTEASNVENGAPKNLVFNNAFILGGSTAANATSPTSATAYLSSTRLYTGRGENIHDGNAYVGTDGLPLLLIQLLRDSASVNYDNIIDTIAEFRSATLLSDAQTFAGYAPGMESTGLAYTATTASQIDANYRPQDSRLRSGAIELTQFSLPGMEFYQAWRGAVGPL